MAYDKTIQMLIFDGNPNGRIKCELSNWDGRVYKLSRTELNKFSTRPDANYTGVYFLFAKDNDNNDLIYVGEAEAIHMRLKQHISDTCLPDWTDCIVVINKDNNLNKAHVKYLESKFYELANQASRFIVTNKKAPTCSSVSEFDSAMLEEFISSTKLLVNTLGYRVFDTYDTNSAQERQPKTIFYIKAARGADARGIIDADGFLVLKGSRIAQSVTNSFSKYLISLRDSMIKSGTINTSFEFTRDQVFTSPSLAAAIVMGRNANGQTEWKTEDHKTIRQIEAESTLE
jgi:hypothetical protein